MGRILHYKIKRRVKIFTDTLAIDALPTIKINLT